MKIYSKKSLLLILLVAFFFQPSFGQQIITADLLRKAKEGKKTFVFAITESEALYEQQEQLLKNVLTEYWHLADSYKILPQKKAEDFVKKHKKRALFVELYDNSSHNELFTSINRLSLSMPSVKRGKILEVFLAGGELSQIDLIYGIKVLQFAYENGEQFSGRKPFKVLSKKYGHLLKEKVLLIGEDQLSKNLTKAIIIKNYLYPFKIVPNEIMEKAIINKNKDHLVIYKAENLISTSVLPSWTIYNPEAGTVISNSTHSPPLIAGSHSKEDKMYAKDFRNFYRSVD